MITCFAGEWYNSLFVCALSEEIYLILFLFVKVFGDDFFLKS